MLPGNINENAEMCSRSICRLHLALLQEHHHEKQAKFSHHNISCSVHICPNIKQTLMASAFQLFTQFPVHTKKKFLFFPLRVSREDKNDRNLEKKPKTLKVKT